MKILFKILFIFVGMGLLVSCSDDDDTPTSDIDTSVLAFDLSLTQAPSCTENPVVNIAGPSEGILYYSVLPAAADAPTGEDLVDAFGLNGSGDSSAVTGGRIVAPENMELVIDDFEFNQNYNLYAVIASEFGYLSDVQTLSYGFEVEELLSQSHQSFAFSPDLGMTEADAFQGKPSITRIEGTCNQYYIDSLWGQDFVAFLAGNPDYNGQYVYPAVLTINDDNTVTVTGDEADTYVLGGEGTYDPATQTVDVVVGQALFTTDFKVQVILRVP